MSSFSIGSTRSAYPEIKLIFLCLFQSPSSSALALGARNRRPFQHCWDVRTTYDDAVQDWYGFPIFIQDGEIQKTDMKAFSPNMTLELVGTQAMELFYDATMATEGTS